MSDLEQRDELTHHDSGYDQAKPVQHKFSEVFGENIFSLNNINPHFPSSVDIQCGEKAILL